MSFDFALAELPAGQVNPVPDARPDKPDEPTTAKAFSGVIVADLNEEVRQTLNLPKEVRGAVIVGLDSASAAGEAGLRQGDIIQEVNKRPVLGAKELAVLSRALHPGDKALLRVWSDGKSGYVALAQR
jgi:serine protease Do